MEQIETIRKINNNKNRHLTGIHSFWFIETRLKEKRRNGIDRNKKKD